MVPLGNNQKTDANLMIVARVYGLQGPLFTAYQELLAGNQPFVRLTPVIDLGLPIKTIDPIFKWKQDYISLQAALSTSEQGYSPYVDQLVQSEVAAITAKLHNITGKNWVGAPIRPSKDEDDGAKWIFQKNSLGFLGDRDADYFWYTPQLAIDYSKGVFTVAFGVRHESTAWHTKLPSAAVPQIAPTPLPGNHAVYWNFVFNSLVGQPQGSLDYSDPAAFALPPTVDPLGVLWAQGFGTTAGCGLLAATQPVNQPNTIHCTLPFPTYVNGSLIPVQRIYLNPLTGVYPSPITVLPATIVQFFTQ